jgi:hypothetical protein
MQATTTLPRPIPLSRPVLQRWFDTAVHAWKAASATAAANRRQRAEQARQVWDLDTASGLSDSTLRDIGAPDWLRVEAAARREADHLSAFELRMGSSGLFDRTQF